MHNGRTRRAATPPVPSGQQPVLGGQVGRDAGEHQRNEAGWTPAGLSAAAKDVAVNNPGLQQAQGTEEPGMIEVALVVGVALMVCVGIGCLSRFALRLSARRTLRYQLSVIAVAPALATSMIVAASEPAKLLTPRHGEAVWSRSAPRWV